MKKRRFYTANTGSGCGIDSQRHESDTLAEPVYNRERIYIDIWAKNYSLNHVWKAPCDAAVDHQHGW